jgi:hypothetical protein
MTTQDQSLMSKTEQIILLRTTEVGPNERAFAAELALGSALVVAYLVDARRRAVPDQDRPVIRIDDASCRKLGLHLVKDYGWRCGDYGVYLARMQFPRASAFWLIENDVRFSRNPPTAFFEAMAQCSHDLLAPYFSPATSEWHWFHRARGRHIKPHRCLFSAVRLSARLVDTLLDKRRKHSRSLLRRSLWPNDEAFVATTAANAGFVSADINSLEGPWYSQERFGYDVTLDGDALPCPGETTELLHSVRYGKAVTQRAMYMATDTEWHVRLRRKLGIRITPHMPW